MSKAKGNKKQAVKETKYNWKLLPLQFILVILPLILDLYVAKSGYSAYPWNSEEDVFKDVFLRGKMIVFMIVAAVTLVLAVCKTIQSDRETRKKTLLLFVPLFVYSGFVVLSTICSEDIRISLQGGMDAMEPLGVLLGYVVMVFYAYLVVESMEDITQITGAAVIGSVCMAIIGVLQTLGKDPLTKEWVQRMFAGDDFIDTYGKLYLTFPKGQAYGTLYNPNYVGTYVAMYVPLLVIGFVLYKQLWKKAVCGVSLAGLLVMLFASQSRTGLIAIIGVGVIMLVFMGRVLRKRWYFVLPVIALAVVAFFALNSYRNNLLINRLKEMFTIEASTAPVRGVDTTGNGVRVVCLETEYKVMMPVSGADYAYIVFEGEEQREVTYDENRTYGYFTLSTGEQIAIQTAVYEDCYAFGLNINGRNFYFTNQLVPGNYKYINDLGRLDECVIPANVFPGYETAASGRGYVWGRSIPLLLSNFIVGSGPDTFAVEFPQNDYVARYQGLFDNTIFTRPHNFYLQMGVQTGTVSLLAFLTFYGMYFVGSCKRYCFRKFERPEEWVGFAAFLCTVGFMASGLANDSLIVVSPIFYVMLGVGLAVNHKLCPLVPKEKVKKEKGLE